MKRGMWFLLLFTVLFFVFVPPGDASNVCCEQTTTGDFCQYTDSSDCDPSFRSASVNCEQTSFCQVGCCFSSEDGACFKNTAKAQCDATGRSTWNSDANCGIDQCQKGCCLIAGESFFVTQTQCKAETSKYKDVNMTFRPEVQTEEACLNIGRLEEEGACVQGQACIFGPRSACPVAQTDKTVNETGNGFYPKVLCSHDALGTSCARQQSTGCVDGREEVYWLDSCGNRENVYSSNKQASYSGGFVLSKTDSCALSGPDDPNCGNCDYAQGTLCGPSPRATFGDVACVDLSCSSVYADRVSPNAGGNKQNGESWCIYDAKVGEGQDVVGSRHYRHLCINGQELTEPCTDFRQELCIQGVLGEPPVGTLQAFSVQGDYVEAICRKNRYETCNECNSNIQDIGIAKTDPFAIQQARQCCDKLARHDCFWQGSDTGGRCVPEVPPGSQFWATDPAVSVVPSTSRSPPAPLAGILSIDTITGQQVATQTGSAATIRPQAATGTPGVNTPGSTAQAQCQDASASCKVTWKAGGITAILGRKAPGSKGWEGVENCECLTKDWILGRHNYCKALGDCGANANILGAITVEGFSYSDVSIDEDGDVDAVTKHLTKAEAADWSRLISPAITEKKPRFWQKFRQDFWDHGFWFPALVFGGEAAANILRGEGFTGPGVVAGLAGKKDQVFPITDALKDYTKLQGEIQSLQTNGGTLAKEIEKLRTQGKDTSALASKLKEVETELTTKTGDFARLKRPDEASAGVNSAFKWINAALWLYTIYEIIDIIAADEETKDVVVTCGPWVAPSGGDNREACHGDPNKPCSLYRCKSLGQLCALVNEGTKEEKCVNINPNDATSPIITPARALILPKLTITEITEQGTPGFTFAEKVNPFTTVTLGVLTNEPAQCKFSKSPGKDYDQIEGAFFGDSLYTLNHTITFALPSEFASDKQMELSTGGTYRIYLRCKDSSGNKNNRDYLIRFDIQPGPDLTPPQIVATSIQHNGFVPFGVNATDFSVFVNEPSTCKWALNDTDYQVMPNAFQCAPSAFNPSSVNFGSYECTTRLEGFTSTQASTYFVRCKDQPTLPDEKRNVNEESFLFSLYGTEELKILSLTPHGTLFEPEQTLTVDTAGGAENGKAICAYSLSDVPFPNMVPFLVTNGSSHTQPLALDQGLHTYYVTCRDAAGNEAKDVADFEITRDTKAPRILYLVAQEALLHIELDEASTCEYSLRGSFLFGNGTKMTGINTRVHEAPYETKDYRITCQDIYENELAFTLFT